MSLTWGNLPKGWKINSTRYQSSLGSIEFLRDGHPYDFIQDEKFIKHAKWKLHLALPDNRNDPAVKEIADHLLKRTDLISFKIGLGDDDFHVNGNKAINKGMTVYVGSRTAAETLGKDLSAKFSHLLGTFTDSSKCEMRDQYCAPGVSMRFDATYHTFKPLPDGTPLRYRQYGAAGISCIAPEYKVLKGSFDPNIIFSPSKGQYPFLENKNPGNKVIAEKHAQQTLDTLIDEFGDYFLGQDATAAYLASGRKLEALPEWAINWRNLEWEKLSTITNNTLHTVAQKQAGEFLKGSVTSDIKFTPDAIKGIPQNNIPPPVSKISNEIIGATEEGSKVKLSWLKKLGKEKLLGKKGLAIVALATGLGITIYGAHDAFSHKNKEQKQSYGK